MAHLSQKELELAARKTYNMTTPAFCHVCVRSNEERGFRLEAPDIVRVFCDNARFGRDCQGTLYYHSLVPDFNLGRESPYAVEYFRSAAKTETTIVVSLYHGGFKDKPYAKFVGPKPQHHQTLPFAGETRGMWDILDRSDSTAVATLETGSRVVKLVVPSLRKRLEFTIEHASLPPDFKFQVSGKLATLAVDDLKNDSMYHVDYTDGRIQATELNGNRDPAAVFMPVEIEYTPVHPGSLSFQTNTGRFSDL